MDHDPRITKLINSQWSLAAWNYLEEWQVPYLRRLLNRGQVATEKAVFDLAEQAIAAEERIRKRYPKLPDLEVEEMVQGAVFQAPAETDPPEMDRLTQRKAEAFGARLDQYAETM